MQYPSVYRVTFSIPNGADVTITQAMKLRREGLKKGAPDIFVAHPSHGSPGLFIEFKYGSNTTSIEQDEMLWQLGKQGYTTAIIYNLDDAMKLIKEYLND